MITVDDIMGTRPCRSWPRGRVEDAFAKLGGTFTTYVGVYEAAVLDGGRTVSLEDLKTTFYRLATRGQYLRGVVYVTRQRVEAQIRRWPAVSPGVAEVRRRLLAWQGDAWEASETRAYAAAVYSADHSAAQSIAPSPAVPAAVYSAAYSAADAARYAAYSDYSSQAHVPYGWDGLLFMARLLDGEL